jgi:hypothetical protein
MEDARPALVGLLGLKDGPDAAIVVHAEIEAEANGVPLATGETTAIAAALLLRRAQADRASAYFETIPRSHCHAIPERTAARRENSVAVT